MAMAAVEVGSDALPGSRRAVPVKLRWSLKSVLSKFFVHRELQTPFVDASALATGLKAAFWTSKSLIIVLGKQQLCQRPFPGNTCLFLFVVLLRHPAALLPCSHQLRAFSVEGVSRSEGQPDKGSVLAPCASLDSPRDSAVSDTHKKAQVHRTHLINDPKFQFWPLDNQ